MSGMVSGLLTKSRGTLSYTEDAWEELDGGEAGPVEKWAGPVER